MLKYNRYHLDADRYRFDFGPCTASKGWAQADTGSDAWYYGIWVNPFELKQIEYCEGDVCEVTAETPEEFAEYLSEMIEFHNNNSEFKHFDCGISDNREDMIAAFAKLGFAEYTA